MSSEFLYILEREIDSRAKELAAQMIAKAKKIEMPSDIAPSGELITPFLFGGKKYLSSKQVAALLGVQYQCLWKWNKDGKLNYRKVGGRLLFSYDDVQAFLRGENSIKRHDN